MAGHTGSQTGPALSGRSRNLLLALGALILLWRLPGLACDGEHLAINATVRTAAPGQFAKLSAGTVQYEVRGQGPTVLLVGGVSMPYSIWDHNFATLARNGFRVIRYNHYGRGLSDRPDVRYDMALFHQQIIDLLAHLKVKRPVHVVGLSMGGLVSVTFARKFPARVRSLALVDPLGIPQSHGLLAALVRAPVFGDYLMTALGDRSLKKRLPNNFFAPDKYPETVVAFTDQMKYRGFKRAILSTLRHTVPHDARPDFAAVGKTDLPTAIFWGKQDRVLPFANSAIVRKAMPQAAFHGFDQVGHHPNYEAPRQFNQSLIQFLKAH